jgi:hypothetical protein
MLVFIVSFLIAAQGVAVNKDRPYSEMPPHGTIYKKKLHGFFGTDPSNDVLGIYAIPENNTSKAEWHRFSLFDVSGPMFSARHHVGFDCIWFSFGPARMYQLKSGELDLFDNSTQNKVKPEDRAKRYREKYGPLDVQKEDRHSFALRSLFDKYLDNCVEIPGPSPLASLKDVAGFGSLPTSISSCKSFILTKNLKYGTARTAGMKKAIDG